MTRIVIIKGSSSRTSNTDTNKPATTATAAATNNNLHVQSVDNSSGFAVWLLRQGIFGTIPWTAGCSDMPQLWKQVGCWKPDIAQFFTLPSAKLKLEIFGSNVGDPYPSVRHLSRCVYLRMHKVHAHVSDDCISVCSRALSRAPPTKGAALE